MLLALLVFAETAANVGTVWEQWLSPAAFERLVQLGGLTLLAILFARGSIITKGQHEARVADLTKYHDAAIKAGDERHVRELAQAAVHHTEMMNEKDRRFDGMKESRDTWRNTADTQSKRADHATDQLLESNELAGLAIQQMEAMEAAARSASPQQKGAEVTT